MPTTGTNPATAFAAALPGPLMEPWTGIAGLYRDAMEKHTQQLLLSSANIIQEHTVRAFVAASNACADALAKNAVAVQQQSLERYAEANRKAMEMMGSAWMKAWMPNGGG
ncbi:hypothetical protein [uncultured Massilia sp.]|uniref:hypothetical protein n=1 Tax=uncultured Massilia sp. TaxID=169973 RepID=UPI0025DC1B70|nr:hypothetical protein [uncultured Massilia sp.]